MAAEQAQANLCSARKRDDGAMPVAVAVSLCVLHDALGVALFLASHPLHTVYLFFFARGLLALAAFFWPLLVSTSLLLVALATAAPYYDGGGGSGSGADEWEWPVGVRSLGRTFGIAVAALCAELRHDDGAPAAAGQVAQLCSFILGPTDAAASLLRVEEIMGEPCDVIITASCFVPVPEEQRMSLLLTGGGDECEEPAFALPVVDYIGDGGFLDYESFGDLLKDEIDEKVVISEYIKGSHPLAEQCCFPRDRDTSFVQEMEAEEEEEESGIIQGQGLISSPISDGVEERRLECDPVSVEMKKSEPVQVLEIGESEPLHAVEMKKCEPAKFEPVEPPEIKECEAGQAVQITILQPTLEVKKSEPVESVAMKKNELVKQRNLIAERIKQWEAQVASGNAKPFVGDREGNSVGFSLKNKSAKDAKKCVRFDADPRAEKCGSEQQSQVAASTEECAAQQQEQEFKDVKEYMRSETETRAVEECSQDMKAEQELLEQQGRNDVQPEPDLRELEHEIAQKLEEVEEVYSDVAQSPAMWNGRESPVKSTSIAGRVHSRTSSENLVSAEGSPSRKDKEWKRTLACKLYEERMQLRLCRDRAVVEGSDNMDMLWEAYEVGSGGGRKGRVGKRSGSKVKGSTDRVEDAVEEGEEEEEDGDDDGDEEGSVGQLCCLQALKFSTRKMNLGGGKPSLSKISKVLKRMTALSRMGSRRKQSE